jgi:hypothetical protein
MGRQASERSRAQTDGRPDGREDGRVGGRTGGRADVWVAMRLGEALSSTTSKQS